MSMQTTKEVSHIDAYDYIPHQNMVKSQTKKTHSFVFTEYFSLCLPIVVTYNQYTIKGEPFYKPNPSKIAVWLY